MLKTKLLNEAKLEWVALHCNYYAQSTKLLKLSLSSMPTTYLRGFLSHSEYIESRKFSSIFPRSIVTFQHDTMCVRLFGRRLWQIFLFMANFRVQLTTQTICRYFILACVFAIRYWQFIRSDNYIEGSRAWLTNWFREGTGHESLPRCLAGQHAKSLSVCDLSMTVMHWSCHWHALRLDSIYFAVSNLALQF